MDKLIDLLLLGCPLHSHPKRHICQITSYLRLIILVFRSYPKKGSVYENHVTRVYACVWLFVRDTE